MLDDEIRKLETMQPDELETKVFLIQKLIQCFIPIVFLLVAIAVTWHWGAIKLVLLVPVAFIAVRACFRSVRMVPPGTVGSIEKRSGIPGYVGSGSLKEARKSLEPARLNDGGWGVVLKRKSRVSVGLIVCSIFGATWMGSAIVFGTLTAAGGSMIGAIGMLIVTPCIYYWLRLFGPAMQLSVESNVIPLGSPMKVRWAKKGLGKVSTLRVVLIGKESTTYTRGTSSYTDNSVIGEFQLVKTEDPKTIAEGKGAIEIPVVAMHTFDSGSNSIFWEIKVDGTVPFWPDTHDTYPIVLVPPEVHK